MLQESLVISAGVKHENIWVPPSGRVESITIVAPIAVGVTKDECCERLGGCFMSVFW